MLRAVMVGCGAMSNGWLKAIRETARISERIEMVGFVDLDPDVAATRAREHGFTDAATGGDLSAMLGETKPDLVFDLVVPPARREVVETALSSGCHVLSEKPMANSIAEARALLELATKKKRVHAIVQNRRHLAGIRRAKALIESRAIGELTALHADFFIGPHFGGFREKMEHVLLLDMAIHTFDAARFLLPEEPVAVYCQETNPKGSWYAHGASANALFDCSDGSIFTYRGSWCAEGADTNWESSWRIVGTGGSVLWDGNDGFEGNIPMAAGEGLLRPTRPVAMPPGVGSAGRRPRRCHPRFRDRDRDRRNTTFGQFGQHPEPRHGFCRDRERGDGTTGLLRNGLQRSKRPMSDPAKSIRIGTMVSASGGEAADRISEIGDLGFESFEPFFWQTTNGQDLAELGKRCLEAIGDRDIRISTLGMFGNPLEEETLDLDTLQGWKDCIDNAHHFGATCVAGFTGRVRGAPLTDSLPRYREVWSELGEARRGPGREDRLRELRDGRQLGRPATGTSPTIPTPGSLSLTRRQRKTSASNGSPATSSST